MVFRQIKIILFFALGVISIPMIGQQANSNKQRLPKVSTDSCYIKQQRLRLKNVAFCKCMYIVYPNDSILINDGSLSGYFQTGPYGVNTFTELNDIAKEYIKKANNTYFSFEDYPLGMMKCLNFYNSNELDSIVKNYDNDIIVYD
jgi:hypothetical protein